MNQDKLKLISPKNGEITDSFLTAILEWGYPIRENRTPYYNITLKVSQNEDMSDPIVNIGLRDNQTSYRLALLPETTYFWEVTPNEVPEMCLKSQFTTGKPKIDTISVV